MGQEADVGEIRFFWCVTLGYQSVLWYPAEVLYIVNALAGAKEA